MKTRDRHVHRLARRFMFEVLPPLNCDGERERESQNQQRRLTDAVLSLLIIGLSPVATHHAQLSRTLSRCFCPEKIKGGDVISITQQH